MHTLLNKYVYHLAYVSHTINILNAHIDPTVCHICAKAQPTALHSSHVIAKYVLATYMPTHRHPHTTLL